MNEIEVEALKHSIERQKYVTELSVGAFNYFTKTFVWLSVGAFALISLKNKLGLNRELIEIVFLGMSTLISLVAFISAFQICFSLVRWYQYRKLECKLSGLDETNPEWWSVLYELAYILVIIVAVLMVWLGKKYFIALV